MRDMAAQPSERPYRAFLMLYSITQNTLQTQIVHRNDLHQRKMYRDAMRPQSQQAREQCRRIAWRHERADRS